MATVSFVCVIILCVVSPIRMQFSSSEVEEGSCIFPPPTAFNLLDTNLAKLINIGLNSWYTPVGSKHFFRSMFEFFQNREAASQAELDAWDLVLEYLGPIEDWHLYGKHATDVCLLVPALNNHLLGIPIFHCALRKNDNPAHALFSNLLSRVVISDFTIIWNDNKSNLLLYRCYNGVQRDWVLFTSDAPIVSNETLNNIIYPFLELYDFSMDNVEFQYYL